MGVRAFLWSSLQPLCALFLFTLYLTPPPFCPMHPHTLPRSLTHIPIPNPSRPALLQHRVNSESAVPDRANPDPNKRQFHCSSRKTKGPTVRATSKKKEKKREKPAVDKWAEVKFFRGAFRHRKGKKITLSRAAAGPELESRREGLDSKKQQRKVTGMIRWGGKLWTNFKVFSFFFSFFIHTHILPHPGWYTVYCSFSRVALLAVFCSRPADAWVLCGVNNKNPSIELVPLLWEHGTDCTDNHWWLNKQNWCQGKWPQGLPVLWWLICLNRQEYHPLAGSGQMFISHRQGHSAAHD